ncbi:MAG: hypothetical protein LBQ90_08290 [Synergistaceae bacterium]|nr:hypothetical protein [Synergistaceae bacterium]
MGVAGGSLLAVVYAFVNHHDPLLYLNVLLVCGFAFSLGWIVSRGIHKFHIRNVPVAAVTGGLVFVAAYAVHWLVYVATVIVDWETNSPYDVTMILQVALAFLQDPQELPEVIQALNREGVWSMRTSSPMAVRGVLLSVLWLAEALVLCYYAVKKPMEEAGKPYSERCDKWMDAQDLPTPAAFIEDVEGFKNALERNDYSALTTPPSPAVDVGGDNVKYATVVLYPDPFDPCLSVRNVSVQAKKKKRETSTKNVVQYLKISPTVARNISLALGGSATPPGAYKGLL